MSLARFVISRRLCLCGLGAIALTGSASAADGPRFRPLCSYSIKDGWSDTGPQNFITRQASANDRSGVPQVVGRIRQALSFTAPFDIYIAEQEDNASARVANGRKVLTVDVGFLQKLNAMVGTEWAAIQVIAHEVGHHIAGFGPTSHRSELNADYWSGQALQRLGSAREPATRTILRVGTERDTMSHPNKYARAMTIERGWDDASQGTIDYSFCLSCR